MKPKTHSETITDAAPPKPASRNQTEAPPELGVLAKMKAAVQTLAELLGSLNAVEQDIEHHRKLAKDTLTDLDANILSVDLNDLKKISVIGACQLQAQLCERRVELLAGPRTEAEEKLSAQNKIAQSAVRRVLMAIHDAHLDRTAKIFLDQQLVDSEAEARAKASTAKIPQQANQRSFTFGQYQLTNMEPAQLADEILTWARGAESEFVELQTVTGK